MDDDTSAVVLIAMVIIIAIVASYATYQYIVNTSQSTPTFPFTGRTRHVSHISLTDFNLAGLANELVEVGI